MKEAITIKSLSITGFSVVTSFISSLFGGWTAGLRCLLICMVVDMLTGVIVAAFYKKSKKTKSGALSSAAGAKGIAKKIMILCLVVVGNQIGILLNIMYPEISVTLIRDATTIAFVTNEAVSILENAALMGIKIPKILMKSLDVLNTKIEKENEKITEEKGENEEC